MNKIEELVSRKTDAIAKTTAKASDIERQIAKKRILIEDHEAKIAKLNRDIEDKQVQLTEQQAYIENQNEVLERLRNEAAILKSFEEDHALVSEAFDTLSSMVRVDPKVKRDGTEVEGFTYDRARSELDRLWRLRVDTEDNAQAIYYGKR